MKLLSCKNQKRRRHGQVGFTLAEMMVTVAIFSIVVLALIGLQLFALRVYTLGATMLSATTSGRETLNGIRDRIRSAKIVYVGNYNATNGAGFTSIPLGLPQMGNALELEYTNTFDTNYLIYYQDPQSTNIYSFSNSVATAYANTALNVEARFVTNYYCFSAEDYQGNVLTNADGYANKPVIHVKMQFYQWQFPIGIIGGQSINSYNFYYLNTRIVRRCNQ